MKFYVGEKEYIVDPEKLQKRFITSSGCEAAVYKFGDEVFKFYKEICLKYRLDEIGIKKLSKIKTKRILLPNEVIYDRNHELFGYTMKYIKPFSKENIYYLTIEKLIKELKYIKQDLLVLKENNVFIDDLCDANFIYNNGIYLIDPGSYEINKNKSKDYVEIMNREIMHDFLMKCVLFRNYKRYDDHKYELNKHFPLDEYLCDVIKENNEQELVYEYSKRVINNL